MDRACGGCPANSYCQNDDPDPADAQCVCQSGYETHDNDPDDSSATSIVCYERRIVSHVGHTKLSSSAQTTPYFFPKVSIPVYGTTEYAHSVYATRYGAIVLTNVKLANQATGQLRAFASPPQSGSSVTFGDQELCLLAPYWTSNLQISTTVSSGLYYKELRKGSGTTDDQTLLAGLPEMVMNGYVAAGFVPEYALIFTWYQMTKSSVPQTVTFQSILITDYKTLYYVTIYEDGRMDFDIPLANYGQSNYPVRVGFSCKNGDAYSYPYSQLPYSDNANKNKIEEIDGVFQTISGLDTDPAALEQRWKANTIGYSDAATGVPSYARRGIHVFLLKTVTEHPVLNCNTWISNVASTTSEQISNSNSPKKCPTNIAQLTGQYTDLGTVGSYQFYFIPVSTGSAEGRMCGYEVTDGYLLPPGSHNQVDGANIYSMYRGSGASDPDFIAERTAYTECCQTGISLTTDTICVDYLAWRPACSDEAFTAPSASGCEGDPHFATFDGVSFSFNGLGTFVLVRAPVFELQGLFGRPLVDGSPGPATVFESVVGLQLLPSVGDTMEIRLGSGGTGVDILVNGAVQTIDFTAFPLGKQYTEVTVKRITNSDSSYTYQMLFAAGFTVNVKPYTGLLSVSVAVIGDWAGQLTGLMGNFNSDPSDDFILPDGTDLGDPTAYTEQDVYSQFGLQWRVLEADSLFTFTSGDTYSSVNDATGYTPVFFNADLTVLFPDPTIRNQAQTICNAGEIPDTNPSEKRECYFDYAVTRDETIATNTANGLAALAVTQSEYANMAPTIANSDVTLAVVAGQSYSNLHTLTVTDANNDAVTLLVISGTVSGVAVNSATGVVSFSNVPNTFPLPTDPYSFEIKISASDGHVSTLWEPKIKYCICQNGGTCDFSASTVTQFTIVPCQCPLAYDGPYCERDRDGCADNPCHTGVECTDATVNQMDIYPDGFYCGSCPIGLVGDGQNCQDDNECTHTPKPCDVTNGQCTNVVGSFYCSCNTGYILGKDLRTCEDIDECALGQDSCDTVATCTNTGGSYTCSCPSGYTNTGTGQTGECQNIDECSTLVNPCPTNSVCVDEAGSYHCECNDGYEYNAATETCDDIDDCLTDTTCEQLCTDAGVNSVTCSCRSEFVVNPSDNTKCVANTACNPTQISQCNGGDTATSSCAVDGGGNVICLCDNGYAFDNSMVCQDIDECTLNTHQCVHATCSNTNGGYTCTCNTGYQPKAGSSYICEDIDECTSGTDSCVAPATCVNSVGSYGCTCPSGYILSVDGINCADINECADPSLNTCDAEDGLCTNTNGGYTCTCKSGYTGNGIQCYDLNECEEAGQGGCAQGCRNTIGGHDCFCNAGYTLNADGTSCDDIDECSSDETNTCSHKDLCTNAVGSYTCGCPTGFILKADGKTCISETACSSSNNCEYGCNVVNTVDTCTCGKGFELNANGYSCDDINECQTGTNLCPAASHVICLNLAGSYECVCTNSSYQQVQSDLCVDVDECETHTDPCNVHAKCVNMDPEYKCECVTGYTLVSGTCVDENECSNGDAACHPLLATCTNTPGGYTCACISGYQGDGITCNDINECALGSSDCDAVRGICTNSPAGSYTCSCPDGYSLASDGKTCVDVDECQAGTSGCEDICNNIPGGYTCDCQDGFSLALDQHTCTVANECDPGHGCQDLCAKIDGVDTCVCYSGNTLVGGTQCQDIDECLASPTPCDSVRGTCTNTDRGYACGCTDGYILGPNNVCNDRDGGFTLWSTWTSCSVTCGNGQQTRTRTCTNPTQEGNGADCVGENTQTQSCREDACQVTTLETNNGMQLDMAGITLTQFNEVNALFGPSIANSINAYCNLNEENAQECCNTNLNFSPTTSMLFTNGDNVLISDGYPYEMENGKLRIPFVVKYSTSNTLCASGTARRRRRAVTLADDELLLTQALLLKIVQLQQYDIVQAFIDGSAVTLGETLSITIENLVAISGTSSTPTTSQTQRTPDWVIVVCVLGAILFIAVIAVIVVALIKMRPSNKVDIREPVEQSEASTTQERPTSRKSIHHEEESAPGPSIRALPHVPGHPRAPQPRPRHHTRVLSVAPMETIDI